MKYSKIIDESTTAKDDNEMINEYKFTSLIETEDLHDHNKVEITNITFINLVKQSAAIALPAILFFMCYYFMGMLNLIFIGQKHNNDNMIKGMGISNLYINCTLMAIVQGLLSGLDTLCSNTYSLKKYKLMGIYLNRARIIGYIATIILVVFHFFTVEHVLRLFRLNEEVIMYGTKYTNALLVYIFFDVHAMVNFRYLNVVRKSHINFIIFLVALALHPVWNYIFIFYLDLDVIGAGISYAISRFIVFALSSIYLHYWNPIPETYFCFTKACFKGLWDFTKFSLGAMFLFCAEWWAYEVQAFIAISIGEDDYAVHVILTQFASLLCSISIGFSFSTTILVGEYIAKASVGVVRKVTYYSLIIAFLTMSFVMLIFFLVRNYLFRMFFDIDRLIEKGTPIISVLCFYEIFDVMQTVFCSAMKGLRKQITASVLTIIQFYVIQTSMSYLFGKILGYGVKGMWIGMSIGGLSAITLYFITFLYIDLNKIKKETLEKLEEDNRQTLNMTNSSIHMREDEKDLEGEDNQKSKAEIPFMIKDNL
jgi:multidrug resistance protein, MATE family